MNLSEKKYIKYKYKYLDLKQKQIMRGGNIFPEKKSDAKIIEIIFALGSATEPIKEILIDTINVTHADTYDEILKKVNSVLDKHYLTNVTEFHYIQEDGDIAYVNKDLLDSTDFYDAIKYNTRFYVYYSY